MNSDLAVVQHHTSTRVVHANRRVLIWLAALLPFLAVALWRWPDGPGFDADDYGQYLMHAQALAEGRPYGDIGYIYSRYRYGLGPASAPPGLPVTLAAVYKVFGPDMFVMKLVMLCFAVAFVLLAGLYFAKQQDTRIGIGVALLCGLPPAIAHASTQLLTDLPFAALLWAVILLVDWPGRLTILRMFAVTLFGAAAVAFRVPGAALFPALILFGILRHREHGVRPFLPALVWLLGVVVLAAGMPIEKFAVIRFGRILDVDPAQVVSNLKAYLPAVFEGHLYPFPSPLVNDLFHVFTGTVMVIGLGAWIRKSFNSFATIFGFAYLAMLLLVPFSQERYLWPLFPAFVFGLLNGVRVIAPRIAPAFRERGSMAALSFAIILVPLGLIAAIREPRRGDLMGLPEMQQVVRVLREDGGDEPLRVVFYKPRSFSWRTGIPAMGAIGGPAPCLISELVRSRITHVIGGRGFDSSDPFPREIRTLAPTRPDLFSEKFRTRHFEVYRFAVQPEEAARARSACADLQKNNSLR